MYLHITIFAGIGNNTPPGYLRSAPHTPKQAPSFLPSQNAHYMSCAYSTACVPVIVSRTSGRVHPALGLSNQQRDTRGLPPCINMLIERLNARNINPSVTSCWIRASLPVLCLVNILLRCPENPRHESRAGRGPHCKGDL
jgi:hypothetical protein